MLTTAQHKLNITLLMCKAIETAAISIATIAKENATKNDKSSIATNCFTDELLVVTNAFVQYTRHPFMLDALWTTLVVERNADWEGYLDDDIVENSWHAMQDAYEPVLQYITEHKLLGYDEQRYMR